MNPFIAYLNFFTPKDARLSHNQREWYRSLLTLTLVGYAIGVYSLIKWTRLDVEALSTTSFLFMLVLVSASFMIRHGQYLVTATNLFMFAIALHSSNMVYQLGGIHSAHILWPVAVISFGYLFLTPRNASVWAGLMALFMGSLLVADLQNSHLPQHTLPESAARLDRISGYILPLLVVWLAQYFSSKWRTKAIERASSLTADSEKKAGELAANAMAMEQVLDVAQDSMQSLADLAAELNDMQASVQQQTNQLSQENKRLAATAESTDQALNVMVDSFADEEREVMRTQKESEQTQALTSASAAAMQQLTDAMEKIKANNDAIEASTQLITGIAEQTNLLALNAAIEAARAGEQGRGFAVVADEVRTLSQRSNTSAEEIRKLLGQSIQDANNGMESVKRTSEQFDRVTESIAQIVQAIQLIAGSVSEQSSQTQSIVNGSHDIRDISEQQTQVTDQLVQSQQRMSEIAKQLAELSHKMAELTG